MASPRGQPHHLPSQVHGRRGGSVHFQKVLAQRFPEPASVSKAEAG